MKTSKTIAIVSTTLVAVFIILLIVGMVANKKNNQYIESIDADSDYLREAFNSGCLIDPTFAAYCNCAFDEITESMGTQNFMLESVAMDRTGNTSDYMDYHMDRAVDICLDEF